MPGARVGEKSIPYSIAHGHLKEVCQLTLTGARCANRENVKRRESMKELEKTYNPAEIEPRLYDKWMEKKYLDRKSVV